MYKLLPFAHTQTLKEKSLSHCAIQIYVVPASSIRHHANRSLTVGLCENISPSIEESMEPHGKNACFLSDMLPRQTFPSRMETSTRTHKACPGRSQVKCHMNRHNFCRPFFVAHCASVPHLFQYRSSHFLPPNTQKKAKKDVWTYNCYLRLPHTFFSTAMLKQLGLTHH